MTREPKSNVTNTGPVESSDQQILQGRRNARDREGTADRTFAFQFFETAALLNHPREFFNEQRNAVGPLDDLVDDIRGQVLDAGLELHHFGDLLFPQPTQRDLGEIRRRSPRRLKLGSKRQQDQQAVVFALTD